MSRRDTLLGKRIILLKDLHDVEDNPAKYRKGDCVTVTSLKLDPNFICIKKPWIKGSERTPRLYPSEYIVIPNGMKARMARLLYGPEKV